MAGHKIFELLDDCIFSHHPRSAILFLLICHTFSSCCLSHTHLKNIWSKWDFLNFQGRKSKNLWNHHLYFVKFSHRRPFLDSWGVFLEDNLVDH